MVVFFVASCLFQKACSKGLLIFCDRHISFVPRFVCEASKHA